MINNILTMEDKESKHKILYSCIIKGSYVKSVSQIGATFAA